MKVGSLFVRYSKDKDKITRNRVHRRLFSPRKDGTLSVQNVDGLELPQIKEIGERAAKQDNKSLYGWAKLTRAAFEDASLRVCIDDEPWCGHTTITGWPDERNERINKQQMLASASCGYLI